MGVLDGWMLICSRGSDLRKLISQVMHCTVTLKII